MVEDIHKNMVLQENSFVCTLRESRPVSVDETCWPWLSFILQWQRLIDPWSVQTVEMLYSHMFLGYGTKEANLKEISLTYRIYPEHSSKYEMKT